jgi:hypothetical protein
MGVSGVWPGSGADGMACSVVAGAWLVSKLGWGRR